MLTTDTFLLLERGRLFVKNIMLQLEKKRKKIKEREEKLFLLKFKFIRKISQFVSEV